MHRVWKALGWVGACLFLAGCGEGGQRLDAARSADTAGVAAEPSSLLAIMRGLEVDMDRVSHALWAERYDSLAAAARAVADHPKVGPEERARILGTLGERAAEFQQADVRVHDAGVELAAAAEARDEERVVRALGALQAGCVACHADFRESLRSTAGAAVP